MLNQEQLKNRVKWILALLSDDYKQGRHALRVRLENGYGYCCLGVACHVVEPQSDQLEVIVGRTQATMSHDFAETVFGLMPADQSAASMWNDRDSYDFKRIADFVAWATEYDLRFEDVDTNVADGYASDWLRQLGYDDGSNTTV